MTIPKDIWHIQGTEDGPSFCILGGTHGNEIVGVHIVKMLLNTFGVSSKPSGKTYKSDYIKGSIYLGFGNPDAIKKMSRSASTGADLNRSFQIEDILRKQNKNDTPDLKRARELFPLLKKIDFLIDIHSTRTPTVPFVCLGNLLPIHKKLIHHIPVKYILTDPNSVLSKDFNKKKLGTVDSVVNQYGASDWSLSQEGLPNPFGIAYETGDEKDFSNIYDIYITIIEFLKTLNFFKTGRFDAYEIKSRNTYNQKVYALTSIIKSKYDSRFIFSEKSFDCWSSLQKGDLIGTYASNGEQVTAHNDCMILFPKVKIRHSPGEVLCYIAHETKPNTIKRALCTQ